MLDKTFSGGHALLVGTGADLPATVRDARRLRDVLADPGRGAYPLSQVQLLTEGGADRAKILAAFDRLIEQTKARDDATVFVYFSGHGGRFKDGEHWTYFLVPHGYNSADRASTAISGEEFTEKIEAIKARKLVVLLDCCHAGGMPAVKDAGEEFIKAPVPPELLRVLDEGGGRVILASSREEEVSYAGDPYSLFTASLLDALTVKASKDGFTRILDVLVYLFNEVPKRSKDRQHPFLKKVLDLGDNFVLCYSAGIAKDLPGTAAKGPSYAPQLAAQRDSLLKVCSIYQDKLARLQAAFAIEAGAATKFQLERQILQAEEDLAEQYRKIDAIEQRLQQG